MTAAWPTGPGQTERIDVELDGRRLPEPTMPALPASRDDFAAAGTGMPEPATVALGPFDLQPGVHTLSVFGLDADANRIWREDLTYTVTDPALTRLAVFKSGAVYEQIVAGPWQDIWGIMLVAPGEDISQIEAGSRSVAYSAFYPQGAARFVLSVDGWPDVDVEQPLELPPEGSTLADLWWMPVTWVVRQGSPAPAPLPTTIGLTLTVYDQAGQVIAERSASYDATS